ncbi:hypothetical protein N865_19685 [Intrasporangium oryzae NRRL B-24470]|uniref:Peptidase M41 domain-containing protein n=1 Tax=Intrasporangium oryzae NRRL B-24470 TaxID=1386089 RepID=W9G559_9MICO|nr:hypothetical protein [Intrasporangium oryzae]EWS99942.1 hypothetical protein N865_19685 [Intrasporangium oryzae NRRL B-24470]
MRVRDAYGTAIHEASHAVIARRLHLRVDHVTLTPPKGYAGLCSVVVSNLAARRRPVLLLTLAGPWAEGRHLHLPGGVLPEGSDSDWNAAVTLARALAGAEWKLALSTGFKAVAQLLGEPEVQAKVKAVAMELLDRRVLTGAEVDEVYRGAHFR